MADEDYNASTIVVDGGIARATIDHPPLNLLDLELILELDRLGQEVEADDDVRVLILDSADPVFFVAHADVTLIQALPTDDPEEESLGAFHVMVERFRTMPKVTIVVIEGIALWRGQRASPVLRPPLRRGASRCWPNPRSSSASSPAEAGPNDCPAWWVGAGPSRSSWAATTSMPSWPNAGAT